MTTAPHQSNFWFLKHEFPFLQNIAESAEYYVYSDPSASLSKQRLFIEKVTAVIFGEHFLDFPPDDSLNNRLHMLKREGILNDSKIINCFYQIKDKGNLAIHDGKGTTNDAISGLLAAYRIAKWLVEVYGETEVELPTAFHKPENLDSRHALHILQQEFAKLEKANERQLEKIRELSSRRSREEEENLKLKAFLASNSMELSEAETRQIIDKQLQDAGWEADTPNLNHQLKGTLPEKGRNMAIAEWPVKGGRADYALFIGEELIGVVEAKKKAKEVLSDMKQAKRYSVDADPVHGGVFLGKWNNYRVPFMFTTNSTGYHYMMETRSGTWFLDGRKATNHPRPLRNWFSPLDLQELYKKDIDEALASLRDDPYEYLKNPKGLNFRYYQVEAVKAVEHVVSMPDAERALLAMATGTGKTRTILSICYKLLKSKRFNRILFLVDRTLLGSQAAGSFKDVIIEDLTAFANIYDIKEIDSIKPDLDTKVHFATVQGMYRRIFDNKDDAARPTPGTYDCIIVDEAHRGYNLDKEMDDEEIHFKDQADYTGKYRQVVEYFDAFLIGMTATPAPNTVSIFGRPVYEYSYNRAVVDGFLVGYEPPYLIKTQLSEYGITWKPGETVMVYNRLTREIEHLDSFEDEIKMEVESFNKKVLTESFNRTVLKELTKHISPDGPEKTLIFAASDDHATDVVRWLKEEFEKRGVPVDDDAIQKITGTVDKPYEAVKHFKNERHPVIVVTVDLLTTGVDVPAICNLVFLRRVNSRILYEQMLGRATRLCDEIGKESFRIYDAVGVYKNLEDFTNMKPVVTAPKSTLQELVDEMAVIEKQEPDIKALAQQKQFEQIIAKLHRKKKRMSGEQQEQFASLSGGLSPDDFIREIREKSKNEDGATYLRDKKILFKFLDEMRGIPQYQLISNHEDRHTGTVRDYSFTDDANDYIESFRKYILENRNKMAALDVICTRPAALTRDSLRELATQLSLAGYDAVKLNTAWKNATNERIAADIVAFIRSLALGNPLISHEDRIKNAMKKVRAMKDWTRVQQQWLNRFESQLISESILHKEDLDRGIFRQEGGGFARLDKIFGNELESVLNTINENLYRESA